MNPDNFQTGNYPPRGDTTSEGGYGGPSPFTSGNQRHADPTSQPPSQPSSDTGLIDQSLNGGPLKDDVQDAKQGEDADTRADFAHEARRDFAGLDPCGRNPDSKDETEA